MPTNLLDALFADGLRGGASAWRKPFVVHGAAARLWPWIEDPLRDADALLAATCESSEPIKVAIDAPDGSHRTSLDRGPLARQHYEAGATVTLLGLERTVPEARRLVDELCAELGLAGGLVRCGAYLSPAGHGVPFHFDAHEVIVIQIAGTKTWRFAPDDLAQEESGTFRPADVRVYWHGAPARREPLTARQVVMSPGSVLFLPRGVWHETRAEVASLSLSIGLKFPTWVDLVTDTVRLGLLADPRWRQPVLQEPGSTGWRRRRAQLAQALRSLGDAVEGRRIARHDRDAERATPRYRRGIGPRLRRVPGGSVRVATSRRRRVLELIPALVSQVLSRRTPRSAAELESVERRLPTWARGAAAQGLVKRLAAAGIVAPVSWP